MHLIRKLTGTAMAVLLLLSSLSVAAIAEGKNASVGTVNSTTWDIENYGNESFSMNDESTELTMESGWNGTVSMLAEIEDGTQGFVMGYDLRFTSPTLNSILSLYGDNSRRLFMRLIRQEDGSLQNTLQLWDGSGIWQSYLGVVTPLDKEVSEVHVQFVRPTGSDDLEWRITSPDGSELYFSETVSQKNFTVTDFLDGWLQLSVGGEGNGSCVFSNPYVAPYDTYLAASIRCRETAFTGRQQTFTASLNQGKEIASCAWTFVEGGEEIDGGSDPVATHVFGKAGDCVVRLKVTDAEGRTATTSRKVEVLDAKDGAAGPRDKRNAAFETVRFVNGDGKEEAWQPLFTELVETYQDQTLTAETLSMKDTVPGDTHLVVVSYGAGPLSEGWDAARFESEYDAYLSALCPTLTKAGQTTDNTVIVLLNLPVSAGDDALSKVRLHADYNDAIRALATKYQCVYADVFTATSGAAWMREDAHLTANAVFSALAPASTALSVSSRVPGSQMNSLPYETDAGQAKALETVNQAATAEELRTALLDRALLLDLSAYNALPLTLQQAVADQLLNGRAKTGFESVDALQSALSRAVYGKRLTSLNADRFAGGFKKMVVAGDSISDGVGATSAATTSWVSQLHRMLEEAQGSEITLLNKAISGTLMSRATSNGAFASAFDRLESEVLKNEPDLLFIAYGYNDMNNQVPVEEFIDVYRQYIRTVQEKLPNTLIVVVGLTYDLADHSRNTILPYNEALRHLAQECDVPYVDVYSRMFGSDWLISDGCHPTDLGYRVMANTIYETVSSYCNLRGSQAVLNVIDDVGETSENGNKNSTPWLIAGIAAAAAVVAGAAATVAVWLRKKKKNR